MAKNSINIGAGLSVEQIQQLLEGEHSEIFDSIIDAKFAARNQHVHVHSVSVDSVEADREDPTQLLISYSYYWSYDLPSDREDDDGGADNNEFESLEATYDAEGNLEYEGPDSRVETD